jgi:hypothetical protein
VPRAYEPLNPALVLCGLDLKRVLADNVTVLHWTAAAHTRRATITVDRYLSKSWALWTVCNGRVSNVETSKQINVFKRVCSFINYGNDSRYLPDTSASRLQRKLSWTVKGCNYLRIYDPKPLPFEEISILMLSSFFFVRYHVLSAAVKKFTTLLDIVPCSQLEIDRRFRGAYCLNHQDS